MITEISSGSRALNHGNSAVALEQPVQSTNEYIIKAVAAFDRGEYEDSIKYYIKAAYKDVSSGPALRPPMIHELYDRAKLPIIFSTFYSNYRRLSCHNTLQRAFIAIGISQCINNLNVKLFLPNEYANVILSYKMQSIALMLLAMGTQTLTERSYEIPFTLNNGVNYNMAIYNLNCGIICNAAPDRRSDAGSFMTKAMDIADRLIENEPTTKHIKLASIIQERMGNSDRALALAETALTSTSEVSLDTLHTTRILAAMDGGSKMVVAHIFN